MDVLRKTELLFARICQRYKKCVLAEELGHYHTTVGDILDLSTASNQKQEYRARLWTYDKMIGLSGIISAYKTGKQEYSPFISCILFTKKERVISLIYPVPCNHSLFFIFVKFIKGILYAL